MQLGSRISPNIKLSHDRPFVIITSTKGDTLSRCHLAFTRGEKRFGTTGDFMESKLDAAITLYTKKYPPVDEEDTPAFARSLVTEADVQAIERQLGIKFPLGARLLLLHYDFSTLDVGYLSFEFGECYSLLVELNTGPGGWWGEGPRPEDLLFIAGTDGWNVLLDVKSSAVSGVECGSAYVDRERLADDLEAFLAGVCLAACASSPTASVNDVLGKVNGLYVQARFWTQFLQGAA